MDVYPVTVTLADGTTHNRCRLIKHADGPANFYEWDQRANDAAVVFSSTDELVDLGKNRQGRRQWAIGGVSVAEQCKPCNAGRSQIVRWRPPEGNVAVAS